MTLVTALRIGVLTSSDSCHEGSRTDTSGPALVQLSEQMGWEVVDYQVSPDEVEPLAGAIISMADVHHADVIFTTGGTGFSTRDVTPEATVMACGRPAPGIAEHIRAESMKVTRRAMLSRATAGLRGTTLVINLPGSEKAAREAFGFVADQLEHAVSMIAGGGH